MTKELEEYAKQLDEEIIELKDKHQNLKARLSLLIGTCEKILNEGKRESNSVVISEKSFSKLRQNVKAIQKNLEEQDLDLENNE